MTSSRKVSMKLEAVKQPSNVRVLILSENKTSIKEFYFIQSYSNLIKIDLSYNKLSSFPAGFTFTSFPHLRTLFLHYNKFSSLKNLVPVTECNSLHYLTLFGNPLQEAKARHLCVNQIKNLMLMDDKVVKIQERSQNLDTNQTDVKVLSFPLIKESCSEGQQNIEFYLETVIKELSIVRKHYLEVNPLIKIQRWWRHVLRKRGRKWNIVELSLKQKLSSFSNLQKSRTELSRLVTQKLPISKSNFEVVSALLRQNWQFWVVLRSLLSQGEIYLSRQYCKLRAIQFSQIESFKVLRHFGHINFDEMRQKRQLSFFNYYHSAIIVKTTSRPLKTLERRNKWKLKRLSKKYQINMEKSATIDRKLEVFDGKYAHYVKPKLSVAVLMEITKKQYFIYINSVLLGHSPDPYPVLSQKLLERSRAAVTIQRLWRGSRVRKQLNARTKIRQEDAAVTIQRWIRNLKFQHRYKFLLQVGEYLKKEKKSNELILEIGQIQAIEQYCSYKQNFGINFLIYFQECSFTIEKVSPFSYSRQSSSSKIIFHSQRKPYPAYLNLTFMADSNLKTYNKAETGKSQILQILFKQVVAVDRLIDGKGTKLIRFTYESVEETLNRKFILALKTYAMLNHQFISSLSVATVPAQNIMSFVDVVNEKKLVSISQEREHLLKEGSPQHTMKALESQKSVSTLNADISIIDNVIFIRIRFFVSATDFSCLLMLKSPAYSVSKKIVHDSSLNSYREGYYLGRKKHISKRYVEDYTEPLSKISRNIISLEQLDESQPPSRKNSIVYQKILNTDQSHSVIQSLSPKNSLGKLHDFQKFELYDKFDREVYPPRTEILRESVKNKRQLQQIKELRQKRSLIEEIRMSHKDKINEIVSQREEQLNRLKKSKSKEHYQTEIRISQLREQLQRQKLRKHNIIKRHFKRGEDSFQGDFLKKGLRSMKKQMRQFQKKSRSFRDCKVVAVAESKPIAKKKIGKDVQTTEIKQFSINFSEEHQSYIRITENERETIKVQEEKKSKHLKSSVSKEVGLESERSYSPDRPARSEGIEAPLETYEERPKVVRKRMVHSVFPEQFYPLKQSKQIGFELPRLGKR